MRSEYSWSVRCHRFVYGINDTRGRGCLCQKEANLQIHRRPVLMSPDITIVGVRSSSDTFRLPLSILDRSSRCYFPPVSFIFCLIIVVILTKPVLIKELTLASLLADSLFNRYCMCEYNQHISYGAIKRSILILSC